MTVAQWSSYDYDLETPATPWRGAEAELVVQADGSEAIHLRVVYADGVSRKLRLQPGSPGVAYLTPDAPELSEAALQLCYNWRGIGPAGSPEEGLEPTLAENLDPARPYRIALTPQQILLQRADKVRSFQLSDRGTSHPVAILGASQSSPGSETLFVLISYTDGQTLTSRLVCEGRLEQMPEGFPAPPRDGFWPILWQDCGPFQIAGGGDSIHVRREGWLWVRSYPLRDHRQPNTLQSLWRAVVTPAVLVADIVGAPIIWPFWPVLATFAWANAFRYGRAKWC